MIWMGPTKQLITHLLLAWLLQLLLYQVPTADAFKECPARWVGFGDSCYRFVRSSSARFMNASFFCENYDARLVSVNSFEENKFLLDWLRDNDPFKRTWLTSAIVSYGLNNWQWSGDPNSKFININDLWLQTTPTGYADRLSYNGAAYAFSQSANSWGLIRVDNSRPVYAFICESNNINTVGNVYLDRKLDYGFNLLDKSQVPRGPKIVEEPTDVVFDISARSHSNQLRLRCAADGYPTPMYTWYKENHNSDRVVGQPIDPLDDERITQTDGTLTIYNPNQMNDKGKYYCIAANQFGRAISQSVSLTFGYILEFNKKRSVERGKENWGKSVSCDAPQHHSKILYYWTKGEVTDFVQEDRRVFISYDGNLYFSSLEKIDRANYSCQIQSLISSTGRIGPSFSIIVEPTSNAQKLQFANGFPKAFPESPLAGQDIRLECMAYGYPTPSYNWSRISPSTQMPKGYSSANDGKVLIIPRARMEDEGEYLCKATSESESLSKSIHVTVQAAPRFSQPIEDQVVGEQESFTWECEAFGSPAVTYSWFKNGEEISQSSVSIIDYSRYTIRDNRFSINGVQRDRDPGTYQCRASNQHGIAFSTAQLRVMNLAPTADKYPMPVTVNSMVDQNLTIPCNAEAIPRPSITWRKEGQLVVDQSRIRVLANGMLHINRLRISDQGIYDCVVENQRGSLTLRTVLQVKPAPVVSGSLARMDLVNYGEPIKVLNCDVQTDYSAELAIVWLKNELPIKFDDPHEPGGSNNNKYFKTDSGHLVIKNVSYVDQGNYTCRVKTSAGYVERSGSLVVRGPPDACGAVSVDSLTHSSARISWTDGADHLSRIFFNTIEGRTNHNPDHWQVIASNITAQILRNPNQFSVSHFYRKSFVLNNLLLPWSIYEFRVSAWNEFGQGPPSAPSPKYRTEMYAPHQPVANVRGGGGKAGTLLIRWDALPVYAWGASEIWYQVYYRLNGTYEWTKQELVAAGGQTDAHTVNIGPDNYYRLFDVMVQPVNQLGAGPLSKVAYIYSAQQMPRVQPTNVHGVAYNSTALNVTWSPMNEEEDSGKLIGYRIRYWPGGRDPQTNSLTSLKRGVDAWGLVVGLQPDTEYHVTVMAHNEAGSGPESESFRIRTFKSAPQRAPTSVSAEFVDDTSVRVTWRGVAPVTTNEEPVLGYKVRYWRLDEPISAARDLLKELGGDELTLTVRDLAPGEVYKLRVLAFSSGGDGKMSSPELIIKVKGAAS